MKQKGNMERREKRRSKYWRRVREKWRNAEERRSEVQKARKEKG